jgi:peptidoglycan/LPS O-acetylase OafA/YrhL
MESAIASTPSAVLPAVSPEAAASRLAGVDLMRLIAFVPVVLIHAVADGATDAATAADGIAVLARFAVSFFFVAFGYFLSPRAPARTAVRLLIRTVPPFFV